MRASMALLGPAVSVLRERGKSITHNDVTVSDNLEPNPRWTHRGARDLDLLERAKAEAASLAHAPTIDEVRSALASIQGSMSEVVIAERGEF